ncbi:hypothetical protein P12x_005789 [Tundrisphaera lichenicola]|uniref:hypothetical protein n=1 Tax=Tundrisphaera lichenicola TaxID=2029860 RepID=UPI003EBBFEE8
MRRFLKIGLTALLAALGLSGDAPADNPPPSEPVIARTLIAVVDDFIVDIYHNGVKVPDDRRELVDEIHGATVERITLDVRRGDWLVFNVVNNRLRWGGTQYFAVSGRGDSGVSVMTEPDSGRWSVCDDPSEVKCFIADRDHWAGHRALPIAFPWGEGDSLMTRHADGWAGKPVWGTSRNTWIKFIAR